MLVEAAIKNRARPEKGEKPRAGERAPREAPVPGGSFCRAGRQNGAGEPAPFPQLR